MKNMLNKIPENINNFKINNEWDNKPNRQLTDFSGAPIPVSRRSTTNYRRRGIERTKSKATIRTLKFIIQYYNGISNSIYLLY